MERHRQSEYLVLRQTIARRGSLRPVLLVSGLGVWAASLIAVLALLPYPVAAAIPSSLFSQLSELSGLYTSAPSASGATSR
jgi:hypothetical protein